jgi:protein-L-isoaspartate O-methyltransferase
MADREHEQLDFEDELRRYSRAEPFVPFDIVVTSGDRYEITHWEQLAFGGNMVVVVQPKSGIRFFRKNQIVAVHVHEPSA